MRFADDIVLITENVKELQEMLNELHEASKAVGLHMNSKKTQVKTNSKINQDSDTKVDNETRERLYITITDASIFQHHHSKKNRPSVESDKGGQLSVEQAPFLYQT